MLYPRTRPTPTEPSMADNSGRLGGRDRRGVKRRVRTLSSRVIAEGLRFPIYCTVTDLSDTGARVNVAASVDLPDQFRLSGTQELGVQFA